MSEVGKKFSATRNSSMNVQATIEELAGVATYGNRKSVLDRAACAVDLPYRTMKGAWYGEFRDQHPVVRLIKLTLENFKLKQQLAALKSAYEGERERQRGKLANELETTRAIAGIDHPAVVAAEIVLGKASSAEDQ